MTKSTVQSIAMAIIRAIAYIFLGIQLPQTPQTQGDTHAQEDVEALQ